jgi:hypothetical protein
MPAARAGAATACCAAAAASPAAAEPPGSPPPPPAATAAPAPRACRAPDVDLEERGSLGGEIERSWRSCAGSSDPAIDAAISFSGGCDCEVNFVYVVRHERSLQIGEDPVPVRWGPTVAVIVKEADWAGRSRAFGVPFKKN